MRLSHAALKICQERYDAQLPPKISEADAEQEWLEHSAEQLVCGMDIRWKRRYPHSSGAEKSSPLLEIKRHGYEISESVARKLRQTGFGESLQMNAEDE
ncbi:hypothetical protein MJP36_14075 [Pseudomonas palleroniana]|uniref:hypothetical protein n=1 Tax=Pseudomonas palleroniana TaxID=191390 RepID=UPI001FCC50BC|nr:hypothetical protein [Pseudomonas palleroniana]UOK41020.1 hypothetical protein MJP36_14075 [Pseudomonas palleroniana]